jgi:hypothetical protein
MPGKSGDFRSLPGRAQVVYPGSDGGSGKGWAIKQDFLLSRAVNKKKK